VASHRLNLLTLSNDLLIRMMKARWLRAAALGTVAACLLFLAGALLLFPAYARQLPAPILPNARWTTAAALAALAELGWTADFYMLWRLSFVVITAVFYIGPALLLLARRRDDPVALLFAVSLTLFGVGATDLPYVLGQWGAPGERLAYGLGALAYGLLIFLAALFPNGRFAPRWTRWIGVGGAALLIYAIFLVPNPTRPPAPHIVAMISLLFLAGAAGQVYRYRRIATAAQRQQTKWVLWAIVLNLVYQLGLNAIYANPTVNALDGRGLFFSLLRTATLTLMTALVPLALTAAILRYRLWDIDLIIRRTLVYAALTAVLSLVYFASIILLQALFDRLVKADSPLIIVLSTLLIAALFAPLRQRVQTLIDRRFYRQKYDAQQVLARFAETCRDETDVQALTAELIRVIQETIQPEHLALWIKPPTIKPPAEEHR
jgi:hypothetical protein